MATIQGILENPNLEEFAAYGASSTPNRFFDMHLFLNNVLNLTQPTKEGKEHAAFSIPTAVRDFIHDVIPAAYRIPENVRYGRLNMVQQEAVLKDDAVRFKTPLEVLLHHPFFEPYRNIVPSPPASPHVEIKDPEPDIVPPSPIVAEPSFSLVDFFEDLIHSGKIMLPLPHEFQTSLCSCL